MSRQRPDRPGHRGLLPWLAALCLLLLGTAWAQQVPVPTLQARVTDLTQTLTPEQRQGIEHDLAELEIRKGAQIALLIVPTTGPETIEEFARRVLDEWRLGRQGVDDGALLLVAKDDRKLRIETQYGLEGVIPDAVGKRIIVEDITPAFKRGDFYGGITAGLGRMIRLVDGEPLPPPPADSGVDEGLDSALFLAAVIVGTLLRLLVGPLIAASLAGGVTAVGSWLLYGVFADAIGGGLVAFFIVLIIGGFGKGGWSSGGGGSGWSSGSSDWGSSSDSGSGGSFSGGGGDGGGGGASGSW